MVFLGGDNFRASVATGASMGNVGWFLLATREVYHPVYPVSRSYLEGVNPRNAVIAHGSITTLYNQQVRNTDVTNTTNVVNVTQVVHANVLVKGAVVTAPAPTAKANAENAEARRNAAAQEHAAKAQAHRANAAKAGPAEAAKKH